MELEERPRSRLPVVLLALFAAGGVALVALVGILGYRGYTEFRTETRAALGANPVIREHLGRIESLEFDLRPGIEIEDPDTFAMRVRGTLGAGVVTVALGRDDEAWLAAGELRLDDGRILPLFPPAERPDPGAVGAGAYGTVDGESAGAAPPRSATGGP